MRLLTKAVFLLLSGFISLAAPILFAAPIIFKPSDIVFHPAPGFPKGAQIVLLKGDLSKAEPYTIRFKLPAGFIILSHWHDKDEQNTVLSGTLNVGSGDKVDKSASTALSAGGYQIVPAMA